MPYEHTKKKEKLWYFLSLWLNWFSAPFSMFEVFVVYVSAPICRQKMPLLHHLNVNDVVNSQNLNHYKRSNQASRRA